MAEKLVGLSLSFCVRDPMGPFATEDAALADAREGLEDDADDYADQVRHNVPTDERTPRLPDDDDDARSHGKE